MKNLFNRKDKKPKTVRLAEAIFAMWPEEEWERLNYTHIPGDEGVRKDILDFAHVNYCVYSIERAKSIARDELSICKDLPPTTARLRILSMFYKDLWTCAITHRTLGSYFWW